MRLFGLLVMATLLSGCMLISGEQTTSDSQSNGGNVSTTFVGAEGATDRFLATGGSGQVTVLAILGESSGKLRLEVVAPDEAVVFALDAVPDQQISRSARVATDGQGRLH